MEITPTSIQIGEEEQKASSEYKMKINEENYIIKIILFSSNINITAQKQNSISSFYNNNFDRKQLNQFSKSFTLFDSINAIYNFIKTIIDEGKSKIFYENEYLILSIPIFLPTGKQEFINFNLNKNKLEKDKIIQNLCEKIQELENTINILTENDKNKNEQINNILKRLQFLEEKEKEREKEREKEKEIEKKLLKDIKESSICKNNEISFFLDLFKNNEKFVDKKFGFKLLFKGPKDGQMISDIHKKIDNIRSVLILIKTTKGIRFGGYSENGFNNSESELKDNKAFVFSLDKKSIYNNKDSPALYSNKTLIGFKNTIYIYDNFCSNNSCLVAGGNSQYPCKRYELNNGEKNFVISDIEIFEINN